MENLIHDSSMPLVLAIIPGVLCCIALVKNIKMLIERKTKIEGDAIKGEIHYQDEYKLITIFRHRSMEYGKYQVRLYYKYKHAFDNGGVFQYNKWILDRITFCYYSEIPSTIAEYITTPV